MRTPANTTENKATKSTSIRRSASGMEQAMPFFQAKLTVNQPGDAYEQEADRVADQVMRMPDPSSTKTSTALAETRIQRQNIQPTPLLSRLATPPVLNRSISDSLVQTKCVDCAQKEQAQKEEERPEQGPGQVMRSSKIHDINGSGIVPIQRACKACSEAEEVKRKEKLPDIPGNQAITVQRACADCAEDDTVQRSESTADAGGQTAPSIVSNVLSSGGGRPMDGGTRNFMESRFGQDFGQVRIHTDGKAAQSAAAINARAYTSGSNVVFGNGEYQPESEGGRRLLAHELVHVGQQGAFQADHIQRSPAKKYPKIESITILKIDGRIVVRLVDGSVFVYKLTTPASDKLEAGEFIANFDGNKYNYKGVSFKFVPVIKDTPLYPANLGETLEFPLIIVQGGNLSSTGPGSGKQGQGPGGGGQSKTPAQAEGDKEGSTQGDKQGEGDGKKKTDEKIKEFIEAFNNHAKKRGGGESLDKEKLALLLKDLTEDEIKGFFEAQTKLKGKHPNKSTLELLELYQKLKPSDREALRVNSLLADSSSKTLEEIPENILLKLSEDATDSTQAGQNLRKVNDAFEQIRSSIRNPDLKASFEPLDEKKLASINYLLLLEGLLAGASERSPEVKELAKETMGQFGQIRGFILRELAWLAAELAATTLLAVLTAPLSGGSSLAAGASVAGILLLRVNKLRKLLNKLMELKEIIHTIQKIIRIVDTLKSLNDQASTQIKDFFEKSKKLDDLRQQLNTEEATEQLYENIEKLEDELLGDIEALLQGKLGDFINEYFFLPDNMSTEELVEVFTDIPKGLRAMKEVMSYESAMDSGNIEAVKVMMLKAFKAGYFLAPLVAFVTGLINDKLANILQDESLVGRILGIGGKQKKRSRKNKDNKKVFGKAAKEKKSKNETERKRRVDEAKAKAEAEAKAQKDKAANQKPVPKDDDLLWENLKSELKELETKYPNGVGPSDFMKDVRAIKNKAVYNSIAKAPIQSRTSTKHGHWEIVVKRNKGLKKIVIHTPMIVSTRYIKLRQEIEKEFRRLKDAQKTREYLETRLKELASVFNYPVTDLKIDEIKNKDQKVIKWTIWGRDRSKQTDWTEIVSVTPIGGYFGSKDDPIPIAWPKPSISNYPILYVGPKISTTDSKSGVTIKQAVLKDAGNNLLTKEKLKSELEQNPKVNQEELNKWKTENLPIRVFHPTSKSSSQQLPYGSKQKYGVKEESQIGLHKEFEMKKSNRINESGTKFNDPLASFGFNPTDEKLNGDHIIDTQLGGENDITNMWMLDADVNQLAGGTIEKMQFINKDDNKKITMKNLKERVRKQPIFFKVKSVNNP